jgi:hypothetical protein
MELYRVPGFDFAFQHGVDEKKIRELAEQMPRDRVDPRGAEKLRILSHPRLLTIDEVGYVPLAPMVSYFIFSRYAADMGKGP